MAMHGERIYLLEQATTQMKYRQSANSVRIIRTGPAISAALLVVGAGRRFYVGEVRGRSGP